MELSRPATRPGRSAPRTGSDPGHPGCSAAQAGVSVVEVLLAAVLFLAIALATIPMFTQSMMSNSSGNDSTRAANFARTKVEELLQLPFNHPSLEIEDGTERVFDEYRSITTGEWLEVPVASGDEAEWLRTSTIRQYHVDALDDDLIEVSEALPAGTDPSFVHLREIEVSVRQIGGFWRNEAKGITLRTIRSQ